MNLKSVLLILTLCAVNLAQATVSTQKEPERWMSLYLGKEANFQPTLVKQIKDICESYGVPYEITADNLILVPAKARPSILMLIAGHYKK